MKEIQSLRSMVAVLGVCVAVLAVGLISLTVRVSRLEAQPTPQTLVTTVSATANPTPQVWQDTNTTTCAPSLALTDHLNRYVWWVLNCGGMWVGNDKLGVAGTNNFNQAIYMWTPDGVHGALVIDGYSMTGRDARFAVCLETQSLSYCRAQLRLAA